MRFHRWLVLSCALVIVSGCATLFAGGNETVRIESSPSGATVRAQNGQTLGTTPFTTTLKPKDYLLTFSAPGYPEASYSLDKKVDGIAFLNLFCVLCWGVDFATGSVWGLSDDFVNVQMGGGGAPVAYSPPAAVAAREEPDPRQCGSIPPLLKFLQPMIAWVWCTRTRTFGQRRVVSFWRQ